MTLTHHQKKVIRLIREEGFTLKYQNGFSSSWWLTKNKKGGFINSIDILHSTAKNLLAHKLIELNHKDEYKHHHYKLTQLGKEIAI